MEKLIDFNLGKDIKGLSTREIKDLKYPYFSNSMPSILTRHPTDYFQEVIKLIYQISWDKKNCLMLFVGGQARQRKGYRGDVDIWLFSKQEMINQMKEKPIQNQVTIIRRENIKRNHVKTKVKFKEVKILDIHETIVNNDRKIENLVRLLLASHPNYDALVPTGNPSLPKHSFLKLSKLTPPHGQVY